MRLPRPLHFLLGAILLGATWLGYWIGQLSHSSSPPEVLQQESVLYKVRAQQKATQHFKGVNNLHNIRSKTYKHGEHRILKTAPPVLQVDEETYQDQQMDRHNTDRVEKKPQVDLEELIGNKHKLKDNLEFLGHNNDRPNNEGNRVEHDIKPPTNNAELGVKPLEPLPPKNIGNTGSTNNISPNLQGLFDDIKKPSKMGKLKQTLIKLSEKNRKKPSGFTIPQGQHQNFLPNAKIAPAVGTSKASKEHYYLLHGGQAVKIHGRIHEKIRTFPDYIPRNHYVFTSKSLPKDPRLRPSVANGHIGTAIHAKSLFMNGLYCGPGGQSHRAEIPSTCSLNITEASPPQNFTRSYTLNVGEGMYTELLQTPTYNVTHRIYAHRTLNRLMVVEVDLVRKDLDSPQNLKTSLNKWHMSPDLSFNNLHSDIDEVSYKVGKANAAERPGKDPPGEVHILYDHIPNYLVPPRNAYRTKWVFLSAIAPTKDEAFEAYKLGSRLAMSNDKLYADHVEAWAHLWGNGSINIIGNDKLAKAVYGSYYYILSSMPLEEDKTWPFIGLSPSGLPFGEFTLDYEGHVFWDQETWMYPPILMLHPDLGKIILQTRNRTKSAARENAKLRRYKGFQYPWESAYSGFEVTPDKEIAEREIHVTGDISFAIMQYLRATGDKRILDDGFQEILAEIANFWVSRLKYSQRLDMFTIPHVIPPDEYQRNVNNSVYTNVLAMLALEAPMTAYKMLGKLTDHWKHFENIYIPFDINLQYHPEFDTYEKGTKVKQADAIMLGYPLQIEMPDHVRRNDLSVYEKVTDISGPAMSWSMFAINYLKLGDERKAESFYKRNFGYIKNEFQVWHETAYGKGATNFVTGMGGFLQMMIFGYAGLGLYEDSLQLQPVLPPDSEQLHLMDFDYLGSSLNLFVERDSYKVVLVRRTEIAPPLKLVIPSQEYQVLLEVNEPVVVKPTSLSYIKEVQAEEMEQQQGQ